MHKAFVLSMLVSATLLAESPATQTRPADSPAKGELQTVAPAVYASVAALCGGKDHLTKNELCKISGNLFKGITFKTPASVMVSGNKDHLNLGWSHYVQWDFGKIMIDWIIQRNDKTTEAEARKYVELSKTHDLVVTWRAIDSSGMGFFEDWYRPGTKRYSFGIKCEVLNIQPIKKTTPTKASAPDAPDELMKLAPDVYTSIKKLCQGRDSLSVAELDKIANANYFDGLMLTTPAQFDATVDKGKQQVRWTHYVNWEFDKIKIRWILHNAKTVSKSEAAAYIERAKNHRFFIRWAVSTPKAKRVYYEGWYPGQKTYSFHLDCDVITINEIERDQRKDAKDE